MIGTIPLSEVLIVSGALFCIGLCGALLRRNAIQIFLSIELMMNSANLALLGYGASLGGRGARDLRRPLPPHRNDRRQPGQPAEVVRRRR